jgi:ABC-type antimicrobial peptide transport system permease subunit
MAPAQKDKLAVAGLVVLILLVIVAMLAPVLAPYPLLVAGFQSVLCGRESRAFSRGG